MTEIETKFRNAVAHFALDYSEEHNLTRTDALMAIARALRLVAEYNQFIDKIGHKQGGSGAR